MIRQEKYDSDAGIRQTMSQTQRHPVLPLLLLCGILCAEPLNAESSNSDQLNTGSGETASCIPPKQIVQITEDSLSHALQSAARYFHFLIIVPEALLADKHTIDTEGCYSLTQLLEQLLQDTELEYDLLGDTIIIRQTITEYPRYNDDEANTIRPEELIVTADSSAEIKPRPLNELTGPAELSINTRQLREAGIYTLSSALELTAGVKIEDNRYAIIRGMTGRYQSIRINGGELPSLDPSGQNFPLDFIPLGILNSINLRKSVYSDAPGQASAGIVSLNTMQLPKQAYAQLTASAIWRPHSNNSTVLQGSQKSANRYGFGDGRQAIPSLLFDNARTGGVDTLSAQQREQAGEAIVGDMGLYRTKSKNSGSLELSTGTTGQYQNIHWGGTLSASVRDRWQHSLIRSTSYSTGTGYSGSSSDFHHEDSRHKRSEHTSDINTLAALGLNISDQQYLGFNTLYLHQGTHHGELIETQGKNEQNINTETAYRRNLIHWTERSLLLHQLYGLHKFTPLTTLNWQISKSTTEYNRPHDLDYRYFSVSEESNYRLQLLPSTASISWRYMEQKSDSFGLHFSHLYGIDLGDALLTGELKTGWEKSVKNREGYNLLYGFTGSKDLTSNGQIMEQTNPSDILTAERITGDSQIPGFILQDTLLEPEQDIGLNGHFYRATQENQASYLLNDLDLNEHWRLISGLRYEQNTLQAELWDAQPEDNKKLENGSRWLPSIAIGFQPPQQRIWLNYRQTVVWPRFNEILPVVYEDLDTRTKTIGNPRLHSSDVHNWDLSWQWQNVSGLELGAALYLKRIRQPIEGAFTDNSEATDSATYSNYSYRNSGQGNVRGLELEADYHLNIGRNQHIKLSGRYARIHSQVSGSDASDYSDYSDYSDDVEEKPKNHRPLQGQPEYIAALRLQYMPGLNQTLSLTGKRSGTQLYITSDQPDLPAVYQQPRNHLDFSWNYRIHPGQLTFSINNMLNTAHRYLQGDYHYLDYRTGREFLLSINVDVQ